MNVTEALASKFRRLVELREERDTTKAAAERAEAEYREYEAELFDELAESPLKGSVKLDLGGRFGVVVFTPRETYYGRILDKDKALDYFDRRAMSDELTRTEISKGKLNEIVREFLEHGKALPDGVDFRANRGISISRRGGDSDESLLG